jgi:gamma-glutamyl-gamma-aminobutyrate hydrolase PuuD
VRRAGPARTAVDELLLQDAFNLHKPILAICHGTQSLNVWCNGSLIQDLKTPVNHRPGREVVEAHPVRIALGRGWRGFCHPMSRLSLRSTQATIRRFRLAGDNLVVTAVSPGDGVIEAVELDSPEPLRFSGAVASGADLRPEAPFPAPSLRRLCRRLRHGNRGELKIRSRRH